MWTIMFIVFIFIFILRVLFLMNAYGVLGYFKYFHHVFELLLVLLGLLSVVMFAIHDHVATKYLTDFNLHSQDRFHFYNIAYYFYNGTVILCILFFLTILRFFSVWRFGRIYHTFFFTCLLSWETLIVVSLTFLLFSYMVWRGIAFLISGLVVVFFNPNVICRFGYNKITNENKPVRHNLLVYILNFGCIIVMMSFICVFAHMYVIARDFYLREWNKLNMVSFVWSEVKNTRKKVSKSSQIVLKEIKERFLK